MDEKFPMFDPAILRQTSPVLVPDPAEVAALKALMFVVLTSLVKNLEKESPGTGLSFIDAISTECQVQLLTATSTSTAPAAAEEIEKQRQNAAKAVTNILDPIRKAFGAGESPAPKLDSRRMQ